MPISPTYKTANNTQLAPLWTESVMSDSGPENLTGLSDSALSIYFKNTSNGVETQGVGTLHISQANPAIVTYQPSSADVVVGMFRAMLWIQFSNGPKSFSLGIWDVVS